MKMLLVNLKHGIYEADQLLDEIATAQLKNLIL